MRKEGSCFSSDSNEKNTGQRHRTWLNDTVRIHRLHLKCIKSNKNRRHTHQNSIIHLRAHPWKRSPVRGQGWLWWGFQGCKQGSQKNTTHRAFFAPLWRPHFGREKQHWIDSTLPSAGYSKPLRVYCSQQTTTSQRNKESGSIWTLRRDIHH